jgi:neutral amino acid transport system permease protein
MVSDHNAPIRHHAPKRIDLGGSVYVTRQTPKKRPAVLVALFAAAFALFSLVGMAPASAADDPPTYDYHFLGNVQYDGDLLEGVRITVDGQGFSNETLTDAEGKWDLGVPKGGKYTITLDEQTLPKGVAVTQGTNTIEAEFGVTKLKAVNFFLGVGERHTTSFVDQLLERVVNGLNFGLMLALAAIGLSLVFGTTGISNFAHGEMVTFGGVMTLAFSTALAWPIWTSIPAAIILSAFFGFVLDFLLWKPLRKKGVGTVQLMIVSIGLSLTLRYIFQFFIGGSVYQLPGSAADKIRFGPFALTPISIASMATSLIVLIAVALWLQRSRIGKATRAVSDNPSLAAASGINVDQVVRIVWILGAGLAGLAGVLIAYFLPGITWDMATGILLLIFAAVTLGGLGTAYGALVGALVVGMFVEVSTLWIPTGIKYVGPLVVLILVLLIRPQGILGRKERIG